MATIIGGRGSPATYAWSSNKMASCLLRVRSASQVVQVCGGGERALRGDAMKNIAVLQGENGRGVGLVVDENGLIADLG